MSRIEQLLEALLNGYTDLPAPQSRVEALLYALIQKGGVNHGELPKIDLISMGMPAVGLDDGQNIDHGAETLIALMEKGTFQYTTLFETAPGVSLPVTATVNSFCAKDAGLYQASSLAYFEGTPLLIILNANAEDDYIHVQTEPLI